MVPAPVPVTANCTGVPDSVRAPLLLTLMVPLFALLVIVPLFCRAGVVMAMVPPVVKVPLLVSWEFALTFMLPVEETGTPLEMLIVLPDNVLVPVIVSEPPVNARVPLCAWKVAPVLPAVTVPVP